MVARSRKCSTSLAAVLSLVCLACGNPIQALHPMSAIPTVVTCAIGCRDRMEITYLGTSGFLMRYGPHAVLTGPLLSNPGPLPRLLAKVRTIPDTDYIDAALKAHPLGRVEAILIGYSHYDHLMDVPYIARKYARDATIFGTPTMGHILHGDATLREELGAHGDTIRQARYRVIQASQLGSADHAGDWIYVGDSSVRFMALKAEHAPNVLRAYSYATGIITQDLDALPARLYQWLGGESYAYLVDFRRADGSIAFRLYYMDAVGRPPNGFIPAFHGRDSTGVAAAVICVGNFDQATGYPEGLIRNVRPHLAIFSHWEDFFQKQTEPLKVLPLTNTRKFVGKVDGALASLPDTAGWVTPAPFATMRFCVCQ